MTEQKKILVVDDDRECLDFTEAVLLREGYEVITAMNGQEGLEKARSECPDLIILDVLMPEQDGWDTCDNLRSEQETRAVPIVYLTCVQGPKTIYGSHGAFETEWDEYLTKPVTPKNLVGAVRRLLEKSAALR
jgi:two-component system alkaline phosphatase synthesis response regulator PhoP